MFDREIYEKRVQWYKDARFGMFIHFGAYAAAARGEWVRSEEEMSIEDYQKYIDAFDPDDCDMKEWARMAKKAGMRYAVMTAKHHDGYALFDTKLSDYKTKKDYVAQFLEAFRAEGIRVGLYFSLLDWHHPDYPHYHDRHHPERNNEAYKDVSHDFENYLHFMHGQVRELCSNYGKLDIMWFDFSYDEMRAEKWQAQKLVEMVRGLQPDIILDNRLEVSGEGFGSLLSNHPSDYCGDFVSPEQIIPPYGLFDEKGRPVLWEACITMNDHWGYHSQDHNYKKTATILRKLVECVSKGGNMILNVGPDARGRFPKEAIHILDEISLWMRDHAESIYGCSYASLKKPENGRITQKDQVLYYHVMEMSIGGIPLYGIHREDVESIYLLSDHSELMIMDNWIVNNYPDIVFVDIKGNDLPDPIDTVIKISLKKKCV
ncbi:alpha-L-fucosidase [uncultured Traorella sp.]|uniref:alpha-L-fucosidase n=1 Tax=uncultured Traorella sp. TaxID=1929048 RepID=UPI0025D37A29|nr:alpha-L-fucosidase [uncultured Traorella sp.]